MFGQQSKTSKSDQLPAQVYAVSSDEALKMANQLWNENQRLRYSDPKSNKEVVRFTYEKPSAKAWLQRDPGRTDNLELIVLWHDSGLYEVFVIGSQHGGQVVGNHQRLAEILHAMLITPSTVTTGPEN